MGKWKSKVVSSPRGKVENAWELGFFNDPDGYLPGLLAAVPVGAPIPAFVYPLSPGIDMLTLMMKGFFENAEFPPPSQVLVSEHELIAQLRGLLGPRGVSVLLQKRLPTLARIEAKVFDALLPPDRPGVFEDLVEWRAFARSSLAAVKPASGDSACGYVVEGGEFDGSCVQFSSDKGSTLFSSAAEFEFAADRGVPSDATVVHFNDVDELSEEEQEQCEAAGMVFDGGLAISVAHVLAGYPTQISRGRGAAHRAVVGQLLPILGQEPDAGGRLLVPENHAGMTAFRRIEPSVRAQRARLPSDGDCYPVDSLSGFVAGEAPAGPAILIEAFLDETDQCAAILDKADRIVVEECVGCHEQRILAFAGETLLVEAGRVHPEDVVDLRLVFDDGALLLALCEVVVGPSNFERDLAEEKFGIENVGGDDDEDTFRIVRQLTLPYEIAWVDHDGNAVEKHAPKPVRSQAVRGQARTSGRHRN